MTIKSKTLVTFALIAYNQEEYIGDAIQGALSQDYENLEVILSDDCSGDETLNIIESMVKGYSGSHKIVINKNSENKGLSSHFNKIMELASGEIIVVAAGDDISLSNRVSNTVKAFNEDPDVMLVSFKDHIIDRHGKKIKENLCTDYRKYDVLTLEDFLAGRRLPTSGASRGLRYSLYKQFGPLSEECPTEDTPYKMRGLIMGKALVFHAPGILCRKHDFNLSGPNRINKMDFDAISNQYIVDFEQARKNKLLTKDPTNKYMEMINKDKAKRQVQQEIHEGNLTLFGYLAKVFFKSGYSFREKAYLGRQVAQKYTSKYKSN
jgi:glycosyltransferase involved in cell wall biosynthesis